LLLATAALLAAMVATSSVPAAAQVDIDGDGVADDSSSIFDGEDNDEEGILDDDEEEDGDEISDVEVGDAFVDGNNICVPVLITYDDGSTDEYDECTDASELLD
jgi:hypothetical protein